MTHKTFLTVHSIIYFVFAIALFFLAEQLWPLYGMEVNDNYAKFLSQHNSIFLGGIAIISFLFRDIEIDIVKKKLFLGLVLTNLLGFIITLYACINGIFSGFGWSDPIFFLFLALVSFLYLKKIK